MEVRIRLQDSYFSKSYSDILLKCRISFKALLATYSEANP